MLAIKPIKLLRGTHSDTGQTGHTRRSWRHEIDPTLMPQIAAILDAALTADAIEPTPEGLE